MKLEDGLYYDPWNPWCGFIRCTGGIAERICCKKGTWLGPGIMFQPFYKVYSHIAWIICWVNSVLIGDRSFLFVCVGV